MTGEQLGLKYLSTSYNSKEATVKTHREAKVWSPNSQSCQFTVRALTWVAQKAWSICTMGVKAFQVQMVWMIVGGLAQWTGQDLKTIQTNRFFYALSYSQWADWAITLLWKVTAAPWTNKAPEPKAEALDSSNLCLMLEMSKDNSDSDTNSTNLTWFLLCNNKSLTVTSTQLSLAARCHVIAAVTHRTGVLVWDLRSFFTVCYLVTTLCKACRYITPLLDTWTGWTNP